MLEVLQEQQATLEQRHRSLVENALGYAADGSFVPVTVLVAIATVEQQMAGLATVIAAAADNQEGDSDGDAPQG